MVQLKALCAYRASPINWFKPVPLIGMKIRFICVILQVAIISQLICSVIPITTTEQALTPEQWFKKFTCSPYEAKGANRTLMQTLLGHECDREPVSWRWKYIDELIPPSNIRIIENSIDERLANMIDVSLTQRAIARVYQRLASGNAEIDVKARQRIAGSRVNDKLCTNHLEQMLEQMDDLSKRLQLKRQDPANNQIKLDERHILLARVLDSFGRYDSGFLSGQDTSFGAYEQCIGSQLLLIDPETNQNKTVASRYCWAHFNTTRHLNPSLLTRKYSRFEQIGRVLATGICIPESCHSKNFEQNKHLIKRLVDKQFKFPSEIYLDENLDLGSIFCLVDDDSEESIWSWHARLFVLVAFGWIIATSLATIFRYKQNSMINKGENKILAALDLRESWLNFTGETDIKRSSFRVNLDTLNGVKVILCFGVVFGHSSVVTLGFSNSIIEGLALYYREPLTHLIRSYILFVESFFVISGLLLTYLGIKKTRKYYHNDFDGSYGSQLKQLAHVWIGIGSKRILRIIPLYLVAFWFMISIYHRLGSGPNWDYGVDENTFIGITRYGGKFGFFGHFVGLAQAWYIFCDLYASLLFVPPMIYLYASGRQKYAYIFTLLMTIICSTLGPIDFLKVDPNYIYDFRESTVRGLMQQLTEFAHIYVAPHYRVNRSLIGSFAGYILYKYETHQDNDYQWPWWFKGPTTWISVFMLAGLIIPSAFIADIAPFIGPSSRLFPMFQLTFIPVIWSLANAILFLRIVTDLKDTYLMRLSSGKLISSLNKLIYAVYLVHLPIILYQVLVLTTHYHPSKMVYTSFFVTNYFISQIIAIVLYVLLENPIDKLTILLLPL